MYIYIVGGTDAFRVKWGRLETENAGGVCVGVFLFVEGTGVSRGIFRPFLFSRGMNFSSFVFYAWSRQYLDAFRKSSGGRCFSVPLFQGTAVRGT